MFNINNIDDIKLYEDKLPDAMNKTKTIEAIKCSFEEPSGRFLKLISIFEMGNLDKTLKFLSQRRLMITTDAMEAAHHKVSLATDDAPVAAGVAVLSCAADTLPKRSLLVVVHPWRELHQSAAALDRQSEFPPPGFLKHLKAKFIALRRETAHAAQQESRAKRQHMCWIRYAEVALGRSCCSNGNRTVMASDAAGDNKSDFKNITATARHGRNERT